VLIDSIFGGCVDTTIAVITIDAVLHPIVSPNGPLSFCEGGWVSLDAGSGFDQYQWYKDSLAIPGGAMRSLTVTQSGNYSVLVTNSGGCSGISQQTTITVFPLPKPCITNIHDTLFSTPGASYQWFMNSQPIPSAASDWFIPTSNGSYTVTMTDSNGCSGTSSPYQLNVQPTALVRIGVVPSVAPGGMTEVPIELVYSQGLESSGANHYTGILRYNGTMISPASSHGGTLGDTRAAGGADRVVGFEGMSAPITTGTLQSIKFTAVLGNDSCTTLTIDTFYWTDANIAVTLQNGSFCESGLCESGGFIHLIEATGKVGLSAPRPNPANNHIIIEYDLIETGRTKLALLDAIGRTAKIIVDKEQRPGHYKTDVAIDDIESGFYLSVLKTPSQLFRQSFLVRK
jgi:hypothetical protein